MPSASLPAASQTLQGWWAAVSSVPLAPTAAPESPAGQPGWPGTGPGLSWGRGGTMARLPAS